MVSLVRRHFGAAPTCPVSFYRAAEYDGPGTLEIFEFRCVLRNGHRGSHRVEEVR